MTAPLDLRAVEARLKLPLRNAAVAVSAWHDANALLTHVRALRAVLQSVAGDEGHSCLLCGMLGDHRQKCKVAAVLAQATDVKPTHHSHKEGIMTRNQWQQLYDLLTTASDEIAAEQGEFSDDAGTLISAREVTQKYLDTTPETEVEPDNS